MSDLRSKLLSGVLAAGLAWAAPARAAEPILVPEFTPASPAEFAIAGMLGSQVQDRLLQDGHIVLTETVIASAVGTSLENCAARAGCPADVLPKVPARMAVVVMIGRAADGTLVGYLRLFVGADPRPAQSVDIPILPGQEYLFAEQVSTSVRQLLNLVGPSPDAVLMAAARLLSGQAPLATSPVPAPVIAPVPAPIVGNPPVPVTRVDLDDPVEPDPKVRTAGGDERPLETLLAGTDVAPRHVLGAESSLRKSGKDPRDWMFEKSPHGGRFTMDIQAGLGIGDIERGADLRVTFDEEGTQTEEWYQEGPFYARRPRGALFLGYAPSAWVDFGLLAGVQYGNRVLTTGYARALPDGTTEVTTNAAQDLQAVQVLFQPRARLYVVPTGPVKPYLATGPEFRVFDGYKIQQSTDGPIYPVPPGGVMYGWNGAGGLMIDPGPIIGFFAEGSYSRMFGLRSGPAQAGAWSSPPPAPPIPTHQTIAIVGGVQFRI